MLLDEFYPHRGDRMVSDIDLLLSPADLPNAIDALYAADYLQQVNRHLNAPTGRPPAFAPIAADDFRNRGDWGFHHAPVLMSPNHRIGVELHTATAMRGTPLNATLQRLAGDAFAATSADAHRRSLSPAFHVLHGFQHAQMKNAHHLRLAIDWRHLLDLRYLRERHGAAVDWPALQAEAEAASVGAMFTVWCWQAGHYVGAPRHTRRIATAARAGAAVPATPPWPLASPDRPAALRLAPPPACPAHTAASATPVRQ